MASNASIASSQLDSMSASVKPPGRSSGGTSAGGAPSLPNEREIQFEVKMVRIKFKE